jgi:hypothetical protein
MQKLDSNRKEFYSIYKNVLKYNVKIEEKPHEIEN